MNLNRLLNFGGIFFTLLVILSACNSPGNNSTLINDFQITKGEECRDNSSNNIAASVNEPIEINTIDLFSSGRAWMNYTNQERDICSGCIDKNGNLLFSFKNTNIYYKSQFEGGAAYISTYSGEFYIIDDMGNVLTSSAESGYDGIASYGDGYFLTYRKPDGFASDEYVFGVIDNTGKVIREINSNECTQVSYEKFEEIISYNGISNNIAAYCGDGIFQFLKDYKYAGSRSSTSGSKCLYTFYDINTDTFFEKECNYMLFPAKVVDRKSVLWVSDKDVIFDFDSKTDNLSDIMLWENNVKEQFGGATFNSGPVSDGKVVYSAFNNYKKYEEDPIYALAYADNTGIHSLNTYIDYMSERWSHLQSLQFDPNSDRLLIHFKGKDNNHYVAIIDSKGTVVMEPQKCDRDYTSWDFSCGRFHIRTENDTLICDTDGNTIFSLSNIGGENISEFSDNVAIIDRGTNSAKIIDINGNILSNGINTAGNHYISFPQS